MKVKHYFYSGNTTTNGEIVQISGLLPIKMV